jgi:hypothetical protein
MVIATLNIWTGSPLLALWVGSRVQGSGPPSMLAVAVVAVTLGALTIALVKLLARVDAAYARVAGRPSSVSRHVPWLRSMRGERPHEKTHARELSPLEVIVITTVVLVVVLFEIWFFFFSPSPIDQRTGRSHKSPLIGAVATRDLTTDRRSTGQARPIQFGVTPISVKPARRMLR